MASTVSEAMEREEEGTVSALFEGSYTLLGECRQFKTYRKKKKKKKRKEKGKSHGKRTMLIRIRGGCIKKVAFQLDLES